MFSAGPEFEGLDERKVRAAIARARAGKPITMERPVDYETMRLKCLELATQQGLKGDEAIKAADRMMKFAREGEVDSGKIETEKATVYKRPPFLDDYKPE